MLFFFKFYIDVDFLRLSIDDKVYERELELALEMSRSESSQETKTTSQDVDVVSQEEETSKVEDDNKENDDTTKRVVQVNEVVAKEPNMVLENNDGKPCLSNRM